MTPPDYHAVSHTLLAQAQAEHAIGDYRQASEKGWGAAAHIVKAVAANQGHPHKAHKLIRANAKRISSSTGDPQIRRFFNRAEQLHRTFYETPLPSPQIAVRLSEVADLIARLETLLP